MKTNKIALCIASSFLFFSLSACNGGGESKEPAHEHEYVEHEEQLATCVATGLEAYYTCSGCEKLFKLENNEYVEIESPIVTPIDSKNHDKQESLVATGDYRTEYKIDETFDLAGVNLALKCESCDGTPLTANDKTRVMVTYPTANATKFVASDVQETPVNVTLTYFNYSVEVPVTVSKKSCSISGLKDLEGHCGYRPFTTLEGVSSNEGTIVYSFATTRDGEYKTAAELGSTFVFNVEEGQESTTYYYKAVIEETDEYKGLSITKTLTITHNDVEWNEGEQKDTFGCSCMSEIIYNKVVSLDNQDIVLTSSTNSISLEGTSYDSSKDIIKEMKLDQYDLGTDLTNLNISELSSTGIYGAKQITVKVESPAEGIVKSYTHTINVPVTLVTKIVNTAPELQAAIWTDTGTPITGYIKMGSNIDTNSNWTENSYDSVYKESTFSGIFDGGNHTIDSKSRSYGLFANLKDATIKNFTINDKWSKNGGENSTVVLAKSIWNTKVENVTVKDVAKGGYTFKETNTDNYGWLCCQRCMGVEFVNCTFDATGFEVVSLLGYGNNYNSISFKNSTFKALRYYRLYQSNYLGINFLNAEGLTIEAMVPSGLATQNVTKGASTSISLAGTYFEQDQVTSIKLGNAELGTDLTNVVIPSDLALSGEQSLVITVNHTNLTTGKVPADGQKSLPLTVEVKVNIA